MRQHARERNESETEDRELTLRDRELEVLRRERDIMQRELEILYREREAERSLRPTASPMTVMNQNSMMRPQLKTLSELLSEFSGSEDTFSVWQRQFELIRATYHLDDGTARILIGMRLRQKAQQWFHSKPEHLEMSVNELIEKMRIMFDHRPTKMDVRKRFEKRIWRNDETFCDYFYDKIILANKIPVDEDELTDYIIDGIPDEITRNQARIQGFKKKEDLLKAFEKVTFRATNRNFMRDNSNTATGKNEGKNKLKPRTSQETAGRSTTDIKCYNCNQAGHLAKNCIKPKRDRGSCFQCGATNHKLRDCPQKGKVMTGSKTPETTAQISNLVDDRRSNNEFLEIVELQISKNGSKYSRECESQFDTASPISLVKSKFIPLNFVASVPDGHYEGINGSALEILGRVEVGIKGKEFSAENVLLRVVPDGAMKCDLILGRDTIKLLDLTLAKREEKHKDVSEILNISESVFQSGEFNHLNVNPELTSETRNRLMQNFRTMYLQAERPIEPKIKFEIKLCVKEKQPFHFTPGRLSYEEKNRLREILDDLLERKIIRPGNSEYASRIVMVKKKTGKTRLCVDYRTLNKITTRDNYPLPIIEDQINALQGKRYFSSLDLKDGFHHVGVAEDSIKYTAFITPFGQFEYLRMPFGLKNAPARFQRYVNEVLSDLIKSGNVIVYMDDFLIATDTWEKHLEVLNEVYRVLIQNCLELRLDKCRFGYEKIEFLGYIISEKGIQPSENGIIAVKDFPTPKNVHDVQRFLGLSSYFRKFIENFASIAGPLYALLKKGATFKFDRPQMDAFETLKRKLIESPILSIYNPGDLTELHCDASSQGFGAVLLQRKADNRFHPIFYFSKRTSEVEARYHSYELETLAIVYALKRFRIYLQGIPFKIVTDCNALVMTLNKKDINPRIARWALELQNFDYNTEHRPGKRMAHVDALSRINSILVVEDNTLEFNLTVCQAQDDKIKELRSRLEKEQDGLYEMRNGLVYRKKGNKLMFYVPRTMEQELLHRYHNEFGHFGADKTYAILQESYWFPEMKTKIRAHIQNCLKCISFSKPSGRIEGFVHGIPKGNVPFELIHIDHLGPIDRTDTVRKYVFVIVDAFTKYVKLYAVKSTKTRETIAHLKDYFQIYSRPKILVSDRGTSFTSKEFDDFMLEMNIKHIKIATGSPQANGQVERYNRVLTPMLGKLYTGKDWHKSLGEIEFAINNTINRVTGKTPSELLYGVKQRGHVVDALKEFILDQDKIEVRDLSKIRNKAAERMEKTRIENEQYVNNKRKVAREYTEGDLVVIKNYEASSSKLTPSYRGPYRVIKRLRNDRYIVADVEGCQISQKPYKGTWEAANMKPWRNGRNVEQSEQMNDLDSDLESEQKDCT